MPNRGSMGRVALICVFIVAVAGCGGSTNRGADGGLDGKGDAKNALDLGSSPETSTAGAGGALGGGGGSGGNDARDGGAERLVTDADPVTDALPPGAPPTADASLAPDATPMADASPASDAPPSTGGPQKDGSADVTQPPVDAASDGSGPDRGCGSLNDPHNCGACGHDCTKVPNVLGPFVSCESGICTFGVYACRLGFANCNSTFDDGCETDVSQPQNCGRCGRACPGTAPTCALINRSNGVCSVSCAPPFPNACGATCTDINTDPMNCGSCGFRCGNGQNVLLPDSACIAGKCIPVACQPGWADCDDQPGCESSLDTEQSCGACGARPTCSLAHVNSMCAAGGATCVDATCAPGYGSCDTTSRDCEAAWGSPAASCLPRYLGTDALSWETLSYSSTAMAADGTLYLAGTFWGAANFDPTGGQDLRRSVRDDAGNLSTDVFVTKIDASGTYAWTRTFGGPGSDGVVGLTVAPDGSSVVLSGGFDTAIDLDPGPGVDVHMAPDTGVVGIYVLKLGSDGARVWADTWTATTVDNVVWANALSMDASGGLYVSGGVSGFTTFDFDPGTEVASRPVGDSAFVVKVNGAGAFGWVALVGGAGCNAGVGRTAVASNGTVWATGSFDGTCDFDPGIGVVRRTVVTPMSDGFVLQLSATGTYLGDWVIGGGMDSAVWVNDIAASMDGSIYVGGRFTGTVDFDPGAGVANRTAGDGADFLLQLMQDGRFGWVARTSSGAVSGLSAAPNAGVLYWGRVTDLASAQDAAAVTMLGADQVPRWTLPVGGDSTSLSGSAVGPTGFAVIGSDSNAADFDPGPRVDMISGQPQFVSRYAF